MSETTHSRPIKALNMSGVLPSSILTEDKLPEVRMVNPCDLHTEDKYQRHLSEASVSLIRRIVTDFSWSRFKPPICSEGEDGKLFVVDGQHTAIAAASHPKIKKIPVMVVQAFTLKDRASAFIGHNRDRLNVTPMQMFYSAVTAGDEVAVAMKKGMDAVGVTIKRSNPPVWEIGDTVAAGGIRALAVRKGAAGVERVLSILMNAKRGPLTSGEIKAVQALCYDKDWRNKFDDEDLSTVIRSKGVEQWEAEAESKVRKGMKMPMYKAVAIRWFTLVPKKRGKSEK